MKNFTYTITDSQGIHARPAGAMSRKAAEFSSVIDIEKEGKIVNAKTILGVMAAGIKCGETITVTVKGEDEDEAATQMEQFFKENL